MKEGCLSHNNFRPHMTQRSTKQPLDRWTPGLTPSDYLRSAHSHEGAHVWKRFPMKENMGGGEGGGDKLFRESFARL